MVEVGDTFRITYIDGRSEIGNLVWSEYGIGPAVIWSHEGHSRGPYPITLPRTQKRQLQQQCSHAGWPELHSTPSLSSAIASLHLSKWTGC